jgi:polyhydroxybutyrate depolymerase
MRLRTLLPLALIVVAVGSCSDSTNAPVTPPTATSTTLAEARVEPALLPTTTTWAPSAAPCTVQGSWDVCEISDFRDRPYDIYVPSSYTESEPIPLVIALHGGGGKAESAITTTCADGDRTSPSCLHNIAEREGFVVVYPNGSGFGLLPNLKTWNAGGGTDGYNCASGKACERAIDDIEYIGAVLDDLESWLHVDTGMVYATGLSNGAAMAHRLGCEMSERFTAIAAVGGTNQFAATEPCDLIMSVSVMQIHGTADPCWTYETSDEACVDNSGGIKLGVAESTAGWVTRLSCPGTGIVTDLPDPADDETTTTRTVWKGCADGSAEVHLMTINGGGHTWPGGDPYLAERIVGRVTSDWDSELVWGFFSQFRRN